MQIIASVLYLIGILFFVIDSWLTASQNKLLKKQNELLISRHDKLVELVRAQSEALKNK